MKYFLSLVLMYTGSFIYAQTFENMNAGLPEVQNSITAFGDADGDGDLDLYLSGAQADYTLAGGLYIYNEGTYTLSNDAGLPLLSLGSARWGDIDNDGDLDLLLLGYDDPNGIGSTDVYLNNNDGTFSALALGLPPSFMGEAAFSDFNNDSFIDIAITGMESNSWTYITKFYKNNGNNTFTELTGVNLPGMNFGRIKFADYNNDGYDDFVLAGINGNTDEFYTRIFNNNGDETFTESGIQLNESWLGDIEWGDYNADGNIDIVVSGTGGSTGAERLTILYKNNGNGTFTNANANLPGVSHSSLCWADFDNDSDLDLLILGSSTTPGEGNYIYNIYNNEGNGIFSPSETAFLTGSYYGDADCGDINDDGRIDIVISGYDEYDTPSSNVFINITMDCSAPENLIAVLDDETFDEIYLEWTPVANTDELLGYNIYRDGVMIIELWPETTYTDIEDLEAGNIYCYTVTAIYSICGESELSNEACAGYVNITELDANNALVYPNPAINYINITSVQKISRITVTNQVGQIVYSDKVNEVNKVNINMQSYPSGAYFVMIETKEGVINKQIIITK